MSRAALVAVIALAAAPDARANLLRNGTFQDDWATRLPENKNHHWAYSSEFQGRRDYNPDGWFVSGSWLWENADAPAGQRRFVLQGPKAAAVQRVNWVLVHDDRKLEGFGDAGGFPAPVPQRSRRPLRVVRDLKLRALARGTAVAANAAVLELWLEPVAPLSTADPIGNRMPPTVTASLRLPAGSFASQWFEVGLPAARWAEASPATGVEGPALPGAVGVALRYEGAAGGRVEVERVELDETSPATLDLLANGGFEQVSSSGYPLGWSAPEKYRYFPPGHYYIFNTWHNTAFENQGLVAGEALIAHAGARSLEMIVPAGDETSVTSGAVTLNQQEARLLEVSAWVKTDRVNMLQIDVLDERGQRLDGFDFIHKAPVSIGSDEWRQLRQVVRPRRPVASVRVRLAARGVNGYTLQDTGVQPQNNSVGTVFWDDVSVFEPESSEEELRARGISPATKAEARPDRPRLVELDLGERLLGENTLTATLLNPGAPGAFSLQWEFRSPEGTLFHGRGARQAVAAGATGTLRLSYTIPATPIRAYTEYRGFLTLLDANDRRVARSELWFSPWTTPVDLQLGALYLPPDHAQLVRLNLGFTEKTMAGLRSVRIDVVRRASGQVLKTMEIPADPAAIKARRERIPSGLRGELMNLLLADLDVSGLPLQPFDSPQRNWIVRATARDAGGQTIASADSPPFCRQAHDPQQPRIDAVAVAKEGVVQVNGAPYMPWAAVYGHVPVYAGGAEPGAADTRDLKNLPDWSIYDGWSSDDYDRVHFDFNAARYVAGAITPRDELVARFAKDNLYAATAFVTPQPVFSLADLVKGALGEAKLDAYLEMCRRAPMVVSVSPGIEESFALFQTKKPEELAGLEAVVEKLRAATGKPVMVGHGGYWNRLEFEKAPFFDIYDPETEPFYPANLHTDLVPLIEGARKAIWLRPQMYEDVPYERWRFHAFVELMRGARGWQFAHGPGDASLFRGLHGELQGLLPAAARGTPLEMKTDPEIEHWGRRLAGRAYVIAATTHGLTLGRWRELAEVGPGGPARASESPTRPRNEANAYGIGADPPAGPSIHGVQYLPAARRWPGGSRLVQWVRLDAAAMPPSFAILVKADGRWTHAGAWGPFDLTRLRSDPLRLSWFLRSFYRHAPGFLGWDDTLVPSAAAYAPDGAARQGALPEPGRWQRLELALDDVSAANKLIDGIAFWHEGGRVQWGRTTIAAGDVETAIWPEPLAEGRERLKTTRIDVPGLKAGTRVRVLFEDREIAAGAGYFVDDFRGEDLYQRFGGGPGVGYGDAPVALHVYEVPVSER